MAQIDPSHYTLTPGYRSAFGPYLLGAYNWFWEEQLEGAVHVDYRGKRGPGAGPDFGWHSPVFGEGELRYYYSHDDEPSVDNFKHQMADNRQRLWFSEQVTLRTNLTGRAVVRWQSDATVVKDFFETEYRQNVQPSSYVELNQDWANWSATAEARPRVNSFLDTTERIDRYALWTLQQNPAFQEAAATAARLGASPQAALTLFEISQAALSERERIESDPALSDEERLLELADLETQEARARDRSCSA